jgi:hypothetical protein
MSTENTSVIDDKKSEESGETAKAEFKSFMTNFMTTIIFTIGIGIFIIGTLGLYTAKVAQSNILPDDIELAPFTVFDRVVKDMPIDVNIMRPSFFSENKNTISQKAIFQSKEYLDSFDNGFLCNIRKLANPSGWFTNIPLFLSSVYDNIVAKNFYFINKLFLYLNYLPESIIMLLYGTIGIFVLVALYVWNIAIGIFYHFVNIPNLFRMSTNNVWEAEGDISLFRFTKFLLFLFIGLPIGLISTFLTPPLFTLYAIFSPLFAKYKIQKLDKTFNIIDFIRDTFSYKKFYFFVLTTISLIVNGVNYLSVKSLVGIIVAICIAYLMGLYDNKMPEEGVNGFTVKIRQNVKHAAVESINMSRPKLVQLCKQIPTADQALENRIKNGVYRTKGVLNGGNDDDMGDIEMTNSETAADTNGETADTNGETAAANGETAAANGETAAANGETTTDANNTNASTESNLHPLTNKDALETRLNQLVQQLKSKQYSQKAGETYNKIVKEIGDIKQQLESFKKTVQSGGKRMSKKYNFRLV